MTLNIALMTDEKKQELMTQFCIAYCGILAKHTLCATNTTGNVIKEATGLDISLFLSHEHGGCQQIGTRISYNEIDMVFFFTDPGNPAYEEDLHYICRLCDQNNVPIATNLGTAEMLIQGSTMGIVDLTKAMRDNPGAGAEVQALADRMVQFMQRNIEEMKVYL